MILTSAENAFLIGSWKTVDIRVPLDAPKLDNEVIQILKHDLSESTFVFRDNQTGNININSQVNKSEEETSFEMSWVYNQSTKVLTYTASDKRETWTE